ncbi:hypothetical protein Sjap_004372 [Stephania japonica]|uniref:3-hydroxyisobutyryl-CoA hydrolase n=1 Tax=Stephania japonica TaxID=461633 RepID=A0AAP0K3E6_9MAGN
MLNFSSVSQYVPALLREPLISPIILEEKSSTRVITLNRPHKLNSLNNDMISDLLKKLTAIEKDPKVKLVILKGNGKAFSTGGDLAAVLRAADDHWSLAASIHREASILIHLIATYDKPLVFAMPEASFGYFPDAGASHFLSKLPGFFGEYLGLTGARINGAEMLACGLATHFIPSIYLASLERELCRTNFANPVVISKILDAFAQRVSTKEESAYRSLDVINKCFSKNTVEEIFSTLEQQAVKGDKWVLTAIKSMKSASPTSLKIYLKSIREGRNQDISQCLIREFRMACHVFHKTVNGDGFEWQPLKLELVSDKMVDQFFTKIEDENWAELQFPSKSSLATLGSAKL